MKKVLLGLAAVVSFAILATVFYFAFLLDYEGMIIEGDFRDIHIGSSKSEVINRILDVDEQYSVTLRVTGYYDPNGEYQSAGVLARKGPTNTDVLDEIRASDRWVLFSSSMLKEGMTLTFSNGELVSIRFVRAPLDP